MGARWRTKSAMKTSRRHWERRMKVTMGEHRGDTLRSLRLINWSGESCDIAWKKGITRVSHMRLSCVKVSVDWRGSHDGLTVVARLCPLKGRYSQVSMLSVCSRVSCWSEPWKPGVSEQVNHSRWGNEDAIAVRSTDRGEWILSVVIQEHADNISIAVWSGSAEVPLCSKFIYSINSKWMTRAFCLNNGMAWITICNSSSVVNIHSALRLPMQFTSAASDRRTFRKRCSWRRIDDSSIHSIPSESSKSGRSCLNWKWGSDQKSNSAEIQRKCRHTWRRISTWETRHRWSLPEHFTKDSTWCEYGRRLRMRSRISSGIVRIIGGGDGSMIFTAPLRLLIERLASDDTIVVSNLIDSSSNYSPPPNPEYHHRVSDDRFTYAFKELQRLSAVVITSVKRVAFSNRLCERNGVFGRIAAIEGVRTLRSPSRMWDEIVLIAYAQPRAEEVGRCRPARFRQGTNCLSKEKVWENCLHRVIERARNCIRN